MPLCQTQQRRALRTAIEEADRPLSPSKTLKLALREHPELGLATVYRIVESGTDEGWVVPVDLPKGLPRWCLRAAS